MSETTPLLQKDIVVPTVAAYDGFWNPYRRVLLASLFLSISFVFTATPLLFAFRTMTCEIYYEHNPPYEGEGDRCSGIKSIDSDTASAISLMAAGTTISGVLNLFVTTWEIKHWGVRSAMFHQTLWPCLRNICQTTGIYLGHSAGINIITYTQAITILGGGAGYMLSANTYISEVVLPEERTAAFGVLQGVAMLGTAIGFTLGGLAGDLWGAPAPFEITLCLLVLSTLFSRFFLPYIPPATAPVSADGSPAEVVKSSAFSFLHCLKVFLPTERTDGKKGKFWGLTLLGLGSFLGVFATSFVPMMLQLVATNSYGFRPTENGYLMSTTSVSRAFFLAICFPKIISSGRKWYSSSSSSSTPATPTSRSPSSTRPSSTHKADIPTDATDFEPHALLGLEDALQEPVAIEAVMKPTDQKHGSAFDLTFLRWSMIVDAGLTALVGFNTTGWHLMLAAGILPLASGTAPAAKGCMMEMVPPEKKADALSAIALIETLAMISTISIFGEVFAQLSELEKPNSVFFLNGATALVAAIVLLAVRFPPSSTLKKLGASAV